MRFKVKYSVYKNTLLHEYEAMRYLMQIWVIQR